MRLPPRVLVLVFLSSVLYAAPAEKALRYHQLLLKKPQAGTVLDRFVDAWLEEDTPAALTDFLRKQCDRPEAIAADHLVLALHLAHEGTDDAQALAAFEKATRLAPDNVVAWMERAKMEARMLEFQGAFKSLETLLTLHPEPKLALDAGKMRGRMLLRLAKTKEAMEAWSALLKQNASDQDLADELVDLQVEEGLYAEAAEQLVLLVSQTKDPYAQATRRLRLGDIRLRLAGKTEALAAYAEALGQSAADSWLEAESLSRVDQAFRREDDLKGLSAHLQTLGKANPQRLALQKAAVTVLAELGDKDQAIAQYRELLQRSPGNREMRESFLDLLERFEKFVDAITQTKTLIEQNPRDKELQLRLAGLQQKAGDKEASAAALAAFLSTQGTDEFDHLRVATQLDQWGRKAEAEASFAKVVAAYPKSFEVRDAYAQFLHRSGKKDQALKVWRELAGGANRDELMALAMGLAARQESQTAFDLLSARVKEFGHEPQFLAPLCQAALAVKQAKAAVPWVLARVQLTDESTGLADALAQAVTVLREAAAIDATLDDLQKKPAPSISERCLISSLLEVQGDLMGAEKVLRGASRPDDVLALQTQTIRLSMSRQEYAKAAAATADLLAMPGGRTAQNAQRRVDLLNRAGEVEEAIKAVELWKQLAPATAQPYLTESQFLRNLGKSEAAVTVLRGAARKFEDDTGIVSALADAYAETGQYAQTERIYLRLYEDAEDQTAKLRWIKSLAEAAQTRGEINGLLTRFRERQKNNTADAVPWLALAAIQSVAQKDADQIASLQEAQRLRPTDSAIATQLARLQEDSGSWQQAIKTLERVAAQDPSGRMTGSIAQVELRNGSAEKAFQMLSTLAGGSKMEARDAEAIADAMASAGDWPRAIEFLAPQVARFPNDYRLGYQMAVALEETGEAAAAQKAFLRVLGVKEELPGFPKQKNTSAATERYYADYPPAAVEVLRIMNTGYIAYRYQQKRSRSAVALKGGYVDIPGSLQDLQAYAGMHLVRLAQDLDDAGKKELVKEFKNAGFKSAEVIASLTTRDRYYSVELPIEALQCSPDDVLLHVLWNSNGNQSPEAASMVERGFHLLKKDHPQLAISKFFSGLASGPEKLEPLLDEVIALAAAAPQQDNNSRNRWWQYARLLGAEQNITEGAPVALSEPAQNKLQELVVNGYVKEPVESQGHAGGLLYVLHMLVQRQKWQELVTLLNNEVVRYRASPAAMKLAESAFRLPGARNNSSSERQPLMLPPVGHLPQHIVSCLAFPDPYNPDSYGSMAPLQNAEGLVKVIDQVKDPHLKVALLWMADEGKQAREVAESLVTRADAPAVDYLLAAAMAQRLDNSDRALELAAVAAGRPLKAEQRKIIDEGLLNLVTNVKNVPDAALEQARLATRRLRTQAGANLPEVALAMEKLSMPDEAKRLRALIAAMPATSGRSSSGLSRAATSSRVNELMKKGNLEGAAQEWLKGRLGEQLDYYNRGNQSYALRNFSSMLREHQSLVQPALKWLESRSSTSQSKRLEFACWLDLFGEKQKAKEAFESLSREMPRNALVRARLIGLTAEKDAAAAGRILEEVPDAMLYEVMQTLFPVMRDLLNAEPRLALLGTLTRMTDRWTGEGRSLPQNVAEVYQGLVGLARYRLSSSMGMEGDMDARPESRNPRLRPPSSMPSTEVVEARLKTHNELCEAMLKFPEMAPWGFASLTLTAEPARLQELARKLLTDAKRPLGAARQGFGSRVSMNEFEGYKRQWLPKPAQYLIREAGGRGDRAAIENDLLPLARKALTGFEMGKVEAYAKLWLCPREEFPASVGAYLRKSSDPSDSYRSHSAENCVPVDVLEARQEKIDIGESLARWVKSNMDWQIPSIARRYVDYLVRNGGTEAIQNYADLLSQQLMGRPEERSTKIAAFVKSYWGPGGQSNGAYLMHNLLEDMIRRPDSLRAGLLMADRAGFSKNSTWRGNVLNQIDLDEVADDADALLVLIKDSPSVKDVKEFDVWQAGSRSSVLSNCFKVIDQGTAPAEVLKKLRESLQAVQPRTFGLDLCTALAVESRDRNGSLAAMIKAHASDLASVPEGRRQGLTQLLKDHMSALKTPATMDPALKKALEPLMGSEMEQRKKLASKLLSARGMGDVITNDTKFFNDAYELVGELVHQDRKNAREVFFKAAQLLEDKSGRDGLSTRPVDGGWTLRSALMGWVLQNSKSIETMGFAHSTFAQDSSGLLILDPGTGVNNWSNGLMDQFKASGGMGNVGRGLKQALVKLEGAMDGAPSAPLVAVFCDWAGKLPVSLRLPAIKWCLKKEHPYAADLEAALRLHLVTDTATRKNVGLRKQLAEIGGIAPMWAHYESLVSDSKLNEQVRIFVAAEVCKREWHGAPAPMVLAAMDLVAKAHGASHACQGYAHVRWIAHAFCELPMDEAWKEAATKQWEPWLMRNARNGEATRYNRAYSPSANTTAGMLAIVARLGKEEWCESLLRETESSQTRYPSALAILVQGGQHALAARWLERWGMDILYYADDDLMWNPMLAAEMPKFVAACKTPDQALLGEMVLNFLKDEPEPAPGMKSRKDRMLVLVPKFLAAKFENPDIRERCLQWLCLTPEVMDVPGLKPEFERSLAAVSPEAYASMGNTWLTNRAVSASAYAMSLQVLNDGNTGPSLALLPKMLTMHGDDGYAERDHVKNWTLGYQFGHIIYRAEARMATGKPFNEESLLSMCKELARKLPQGSETSASDTVAAHATSLLMIHHARKGSLPEFEAWRKSLPEAELKRCEAQFLRGKNSIWSVCHSVFGKPKLLLSLEERSRVVNALLGVDWVGKLFPATGQALPNLCNVIFNQEKLFAMEEAGAAALVFAKTLPRGGRTAGEAADLLAQQGKTADAVPVYDLAIEQTQDANARAALTFRKVEVLERLNKKPEALTVLGALDKEKLGAANKKLLETVLKRLASPPAAEL